ncbi:MAG: serine hydrolase [Parvularculaceae bacterium]|nr:serine hydrolase [Parvularculaceae bacterium]
MRKLALPLFAAVCAVAVAAAYWYVRPGSEFSPREVIAFSQAEDRREAFRMMEKIYPSLPLDSGGYVSTFDRALRDLDIQYTWQGEDRTFDGFAERRNVQGIYVLKDRQVVYERYFGEAGANDQFTSWSVAKSVISSLIGVAIKDGKIESLDDMASDYAKEYVGTDFGNTSIRNLLLMSSGIDFNEDYEAPGSDIRKLFLDTFLWNRDVDNVVRAHKRNRPAGEDFDYISSATQVLSGVLRNAYGQSVVATFNEKLAAPLGISGGTWLTDRQGPTGKVLGYCCMQLTLEDYAKLGQLYADDGKVGTQQVLPEGWATFVGEAGTPDHEPGGEGQLGYGHHFWTIGGDEGAITMQGYNGQIVHIDPDESVVIVFVSADREHPGADDVPEFVRLLQAIKSELQSN